MLRLEPPIRAVVFDYGNTLIEFSRRQVDSCDAALARALLALRGPFDEVAFESLREECRLWPYRNGYRESELSLTTRHTLERLYGTPGSDDEVKALVSARFEAFVGCIDVEPSVLELLARLRRRYRLGLLSNYPCGRSIRASIERTGIAAHLDAIVVSGEIGWAKPHPIAFAHAAEALGVSPAEILYVGDNWLADVQGSKRAGMRCVYVRRWLSPEHFERQPGDLEPDVILERLEDLPDLL